MLKVKLFQMNLIPVHLVVFFKRITPTVKSHTVGAIYEDSYDRTNMFNKAVGKCPEAEILLEGQPIRCLIDTSSQVSTVTEGFSRKLLKEKTHLTDLTRWLMFMIKKYLFAQKKKMQVEVSCDEHNVKWDDLPFKPNLGDIELTTL